MNPSIEKALFTTSVIGMIIGVLLLIISLQDNNNVGRVVLSSLGFLVFLFMFIFYFWKK